MAASATRPNVVLICSDQHRADTIGAYGNTICHTPTLDRLAGQGVQFNRCYATNPVCSPSRATILTGCGTRRHGVLRNGIPLRTDMPTLAQVLGSEGYDTAAVGKLHITPHQAGPVEAPFYGFEHVENSEDPKFGPFLDWAIANYPEHEGYLIGTLFNLPTEDDYWQGRRDLRREVDAARERYVRLLEISDTCNWGYGHYCPLPEAAHQTTWITDRAIACVEGHDTSKPLLLWVGYQDPHNPFDPPKRFRDMYSPDSVEPPVGIEADETLLPPHLRAFRQSYRGFTETDWRTLRALYYGSITFMDQSIGRLLTTLERRLDMSNTIIVYTADHGEILGDHGICGKWAYHYESCIRVPLIFRWDGHWCTGSRQEAITELTDLMPTLLDAAGVDAETVMDGRSVECLLRGEQLRTPRDCAFIESFNGAPLDPTPPPQCWPRTVRTRRWRATFFPETDFGELYDLEADPFELTNLWREPTLRGVVEEHRRLLVDRLVMMDFPLAPQRYAV